MNFKESGEEQTYVTELKQPGLFFTYVTERNAIRFVLRRAYWISL